MYLPQPESTPLPGRGLDVIGFSILTAIDLRVLRQPNMWPVQLTAGLIGISLLGTCASLDSELAF